MWYKLYKIKEFIRILKYVLMVWIKHPQLIIKEWLTTWFIIAVDKENKSRCYY